MPKDGEPPLDLSNVKAVLNGSEPISAATVRRFNEAFDPYGFKPEAIKPAYGLAEATLFVSTTPADEPPKIVSVDRDALNNHRFVEVPEDSPTAVAQASAGKVGIAEWATIVDAESATELPDGQIGEIWISGQNMGTGYWGKPDETRRDLPEHPEVADQPVARRRRDRRRHVGAHRRLRRLPRRRALHHRAASRIWSSSTAATTTRRTWSTPRRRPAARCAPASSPRSRCRPTSCPPRCSRTRHAGLKHDPEDSSEQLVIVGERAPGAHKLDLAPGRRRHPRGDRGAPRRHRARRAADPCGSDPADLERQDRPPRLPGRLPGRQPAQRQDRQRLPRRDGLTGIIRRVDTGRRRGPK